MNGNSCCTWWELWGQMGWVQIPALQVTLEHRRQPLTFFHLSVSWE